MKRLLLLGGGHSHVEVLRQFGLRRAAGAEITLVSPARHTAYSGMLPGLIAGHYRFHDTHIDLEYLARFAGARLVPTAACNIDTRRREVVLADGGAIEYDLLSIDIGSNSARPAVTGSADAAIAVKPVEEFLPAWNTLIGRASSGEVKTILVVGGGAGGVELLLAMQHRLAQLPAARATGFALLTDGDRLLPALNPGTRRAFERILAERRIKVHFNCRVSSVEPTAAVLADGTRVAADAIILATGAGAPAWLRETALELNTAGFIATDERLQSLSHPGVFAAGDCATIAGYSYPKSGVYAVRQGPILARNLRLALAGDALATYRPQPRTLALISTGDQSAVAAYGGLAAQGAWVWRWKDYIDRKFMARYAAPV